MTEITVEIINRMVTKRRPIKVSYYSGSYKECSFIVDIKELSTGNDLNIEKRKTNKVLN